MLADIKGAVESGLATLGVPNGSADAALPADPANGDVTTVAALSAAKELGVAPRAFAEQLAQVLAKDARIDAAWVAGPGFVNMTLAQGYIADKLQEALNAGASFGKGHGAEPFAACYVPSADDLRQRWYAQCAAALAAHLGAEAMVVTNKGDVAAAQARIEAALDKTDAFGKASERELAALAGQGAVIFQALERASSVQFFAQKSADFRPGLFEFTVRPLSLLCRGAAALNVADPDCDLTKLNVMARRADKALKVTSQKVRLPMADNPAFLIRYAYMHARRGKTKTVTPMKTFERALACKLLSFPAVFRLSHELAEPQRIGLFLAQVAYDVAFGGPAHAQRGPNAISQPVLAVADVVFSVGLSILDIQALDEIS